MKENEITVEVLSRLAAGEPPSNFGYDHEEVIVAVSKILLASKTQKPYAWALEYHSGMSTVSLQRPSGKSWATNNAIVKELFSNPVAHLLPIPITEIQLRQIYAEGYDNGDCRVSRGGAGFDDCYGERLESDWLKSDAYQAARKLSGENAND